MDWFAKAFIKASLAWLVLGVTLGVAMAAHAPWSVFRPAHLHMLVLGFVTMMISGVAYHVVPRFVGAPLYSRRAPVWHWFASNIGLACMATGFVLRALGMASGTAVLATGGILSAAGAYTFAYVLWRTMDVSAGKQSVAVPLQRSAPGVGRTTA